MKHPSEWSREELNLHLQHALDLELWTIPLYLSALYSIKGLSARSHDDYPPAAKLIFSVVIQEMLHAELVCNLSQALGYKPVFNFPTYDPAKGIPFIHPSDDMLPEIVKGYRVEPGPLDQDRLKLFCAIELPHPKSEIRWNEVQAYDSIAELYEAIRIGVSSSWDRYFVGAENNTRQKTTFNEYCNVEGRAHGFSIRIDSLKEALEAIEAIVEQGEGADTKHVPSEFQPPPYHPGHHDDIAWYKGDLSHYQKFKLLLHSHDRLPETYPLVQGVDARELNQQMLQQFKGFWAQMENSFHSEGEDMSPQFWRGMFGLIQSICAVWEAGAAPVFDHGT